MKECKKQRKKCRNLLVVIMAVIMMLPLSRISYAEENGSKDSNRFNVVVVLDDSNSMNYTDNHGYRYESIGLFVNLLAEQGNLVGGVVFSDDIVNTQALKEMSNQSIKDEFVQNMSQTTPIGYTNIGKGLDTAVTMLKDNGNPDLPSVILFLSDGNTEMPNQESYEESLNLKAEAIQKARENEIQIYSVCLNANNRADVTEMQQISDATGGQFQEVVSPEDLNDVFNTFYDLIYGTSTILLIDEEFPDTGILEEHFELPAFGVEEVNVIIYGKINGVNVYNPKGEQVQTNVIDSEVYSIVKFKDIMAGEWKLITEGEPGTSIKVNMMYNSNLHVNIESDVENSITSPDIPIQIHSTLESASEVAQKAEQYGGYNATLLILDNSRQPVKELPMNVQDGGFYADLQLEEGVYYFQTKVTGTYLERSSMELGPIKVDPEYNPNSEDEEEVVINTPPVPVVTPVEDTIFLIPFKKNEYSIDMNGLATDAEDSVLQYSIVSSSFLENKDYTVQDNIIHMSDFSLSKGAYTIRAMDSMGEYCEIEVIINAVNVGLITLIVIGILIVIAIGIIAFVIWYWRGRPLKGAVTVRSVKQGVQSSDTIDRGHGPIRLSKFKVDSVGLDHRKTYIQCTGKNYVYLKTNVPVKNSMSRGESKKVLIKNNVETRVTIGDSMDALFITYISKIKDQRARGTQRRGGRPVSSPRGRGTGKR